MIKDTSSLNDIPSEQLSHEINETMSPNLNEVVTPDKKQEINQEEIQKKSHYLETYQQMMEIEIDRSQKLYNLTKQEESKLFLYHKQLGNRWTKISQLLNKTINTVKNHFYSTIRRGVRNLNSFVKRKKYKIEGVSAYVQPKIIMKLMEVIDDKYTQKLGVSDKLIELCQRIKELLIQLSRTQNQFDEKKVKQVLSDLHEFDNTYKRKRKIKSSSKKKTNIYENSYLKMDKDKLWQKDNQTQLKLQQHQPKIEQNNYFFTDKLKQKNDQLHYPFLNSSQFQIQNTVSNIGDHSIRASLILPQRKISNKQDQISTNSLNQPNSRAFANSSISSGVPQSLNMYSNDELVRLYYQSYNEIHQKIAFCNNVSQVLQMRMNIPPTLSFPRLPQFNFQPLK